MTSLKLLGGASFRSFRCLWMLEELAVPYQHVVAAAPQSPEVKNYNPLGKVPVLVEPDGFVLYESVAINTYLGDKYRCPIKDNKNNTTPLVPSADDTRQRALYNQTMSVLSTELDTQGLWIHRKHESMGHVFTYIPDAVTHARKQFHKTNRTLMQQLKNNSQGPYLLGTDFTAADIFYVHCLDWSTSIGWNDKWKEDPVMIQYLKLCQERPAYIKVKAIRTAENAASKRNSSNL
jgi:glutathione S-transferase